MKAQAITAAVPLDKRDGRRSRLLLTATMRTDEGEAIAYILNLSRTGAKLDADTPPAAGSTLTLVRGSLEAKGHVAWVERHRFGIRFDEPIEDSVLAEQLEAIRPRVIRPN